jgi:hypothetical protein
MRFKIVEQDDDARQVIEEEFTRRYKEDLQTPVNQICRDLDLSQHLRDKYVYRIRKYDHVCRIIRDGETELMRIIPFEDAPVIVGDSLEDKLKNSYYHDLEVTVRGLISKYGFKYHRGMDLIRSVCLETGVYRVAAGKGGTLLVERIKGRI